MLSLSYNGQAEFIEAFNSTSRYTSIHIGSAVAQWYSA